MPAPDLIDITNNKLFNFPYIINDFGVSIVPILCFKDDLYKERWRHNEYISWIRNETLKQYKRRIKKKKNENK